MIKLVIKDQISTDLKNRASRLAGVPKGAFQIFRSHTPIRTGNARKRTVLKDQVIEARYPYAQNLDQGSSNQAPDGMSKPTEHWIKKTVDRILEK